MVNFNEQGSNVRDDNYSQSFNISEDRNNQQIYDVGKIAWISNQISEEFSHQRIKVLDKFFYWCSFW